METVHFSFRLSVALKAQLDKLAERENRSVGNLIETLLREAVAFREKAPDRRK